MLEEGLASAADIDKAIKLAFNHPMGPLELGDFNGLDTYLDAVTGLGAAHGDRFRPTVNLRNMVAAGRLGRKSGQGFYRYDAERQADRRMSALPRRRRWGLRSSSCTMTVSPWLTLNRPDGGQRPQPAHAPGTGARLRFVVASDDVAALVLTGAGDRFFCAGMDLKESGGRRDLRAAAGTAAFQPRHRHARRTARADDRGDQRIRPGRRPGDGAGLRPARPGRRGAGRVCPNSLTASYRAAEGRSDCPG